MRALFFALLFLTGPAFAQTLPARFQVINVASDDTLNVRSRPNAQGEVIAELDPLETGIEVIRLSNDGGWGRIAVGEVSGWVSMRFLAPTEDPTTLGLSRPMKCAGSEPDWILLMERDQTLFFSANASPNPIELTPETEASAGRDGLAVFRSSTDERYTVMIARGFCTDAMSDREYGFQTMLFVESTGGNFFESGCCSLDLR